MSANPDADAHEIRLEGLQSLAPGQARKFRFRRDGEDVEGFIMRHGDGLVAYVNRCPHWGVDLDMGEGTFYAPKVDRILCRNHGALFEPHSGYCDNGPCAGASLEPLRLRFEGDVVVVHVGARP
jgi:nitrite reductase/ring-hydroxylating ferredoxin subunit